MRPRKTENRHLPPRLYERKRKRKSGKVWVSYYYLDRSGKEITLGADLNIARIKWAELEAKDKALGVKQKKTHKKLRIMLEVDGLASGLGVLIEKILKRNEAHSSPYLILTEAGKRVTAAMLRHRWDDAREEAVKEAVAAGDQVLAGRISQFQFRDIRPKAASEITDVDHASLLLGHTKGDITERVYRRVGALAKPTK